MGGWGDVLRGTTSLEVGGVDLRVRIARCMKGGNSGLRVEPWVRGPREKVKQKGLLEDRLPHLQTVPLSIRWERKKMKICLLFLLFSTWSSSSPACNLLSFTTRERQAGNNSGGNSRREHSEQQLSLAACPAPPQDGSRLSREPGGYGKGRWRIRGENREEGGGGEKAMKCLGRWMGGAGRGTCEVV